MLIKIPIVIYETGTYNPETRSYENIQEIAQFKEYAKKPKNALKKRFFQLPVNVPDETITKTVDINNAYNFFVEDSQLMEDTENE